MHITIVGTGYVGLVSAACFAELGHDVVGVDINAAKVELLRKGRSPIYEPGLEELIAKNLKNERLRFTTNLIDALPASQIVFSAVATPPDKHHRADLKAVFSVAETVARFSDHEVMFVNKSTIPVGTGKLCEAKIAAILRKRKASFSIPVISNPEFLREGMAVPDTLMPERIIVGINGPPFSRTDEKKSRSRDSLPGRQAGKIAPISGFRPSTSSGRPEPVEGRTAATIDDDHRYTHCKRTMEDLYRPITRVGKPLIFMSRESAEIVKYASNAFLAAKISFINMVAELAEKTGANVRDIARGMGLDSRIGPRFLHAGIGYGGSCFPKDVKALIQTGRDFAVDMAMVEATDRINSRARHRFFRSIVKALPRRATVGVWGLSFKPKTDDMRDAPSLDLLPLLIKAGCSVRVYDPAAMRGARKLLGKSVHFGSDALSVARGADAVVLLTEWDDFRGIDLAELKSVMRGSLLFDGRNVYEPDEVRAAGLKYHGIGIASTAP